MQDITEENVNLEFERRNMKEGFGGIRRILSFSSAEFLTQLPGKDLLGLLLSKAITTCQKLTFVNFLHQIYVVHQYET